jgi:hypothetical protein
LSLLGFDLLSSKGGLEKETFTEIASGYGKLEWAPAVRVKYAILIGSIPL